MCLFGYVWRAVNANREINPLTIRQRVDLAKNCPLTDISTLVRTVKVL